MSSSIITRRATVDEAPLLFDLVNSAYSVEKGADGVAFKKTDRYNNIAEVAADIDGEQKASNAAGFSIFLVAVDFDTANENNEMKKETIAGCVRLSVSKEEGVATYGPFAVARSHQKKGVGSALLRSVEELVTAAGASRIDIQVVNHRVDLVPFYKARGYHETGTAPCDAAHNCDESTLTRPSHFVVLSKKIQQERPECSERFA